MPKYRRSRCFEFMLHCRTEYDRLVSTNMQPPGFVIKKYKRQFKSVQHKPEVVNTDLEQVHVAHDTQETQGEAEVGTEGLPIARHHPQPHPHPRRHRARRASTVLQDSIIDPAKAMVDGVASNPAQAPAAAAAEPQEPQTFTSGISSPFAQNH